MPLIQQPPSPAAGTLLSRLHAIQKEHGYLQEIALRQAARELDVPLSRLYSAATFYASLSLRPRGHHTIQVCLGTACYIRGGKRLLDKLSATLGIEPGETTPDSAFTLEIVYCLGSCSMSPVIRVDNDIYGRLKADYIDRVLERYQPSESGVGASREETL
jgi:NADH:ubiquinone oxidoreductase subunit E